MKLRKLSGATAFLATGALLLTACTPGDDGNGNGDDGNGNGADNGAAEENGDNGGGEAGPPRGYWW